MPQSEQKNIWQRLSDAMHACSYIRKDTRVTGFGGGYTAVSHDAVTSKVRHHLLSHGIIAMSTVRKSKQYSSVVQRKSGEAIVYRCEVTVATDFINIDNPSDRFQILSIGTGEDSGDKAPGKAVSYACKYALLKALMLETGDDSDKDASVESAPAAKAQGNPDRAEALALYAKLAATNPDKANKIAAKAKADGDYADAVRAFKDELHSAPADEIGQQP